MSKKLIAVLVLTFQHCLAASVQNADESVWIQIGRTEEYDIYVPKVNPKTNLAGNRMQWSMRSRLTVTPGSNTNESQLRQDLMNFFDAGPVSYTTLYEVDCGNDKLMALEFVAYSALMTRGKVETGYRLSESQLKWSYAGPGTVEEMILQTTCKS